MKPIPHPQRGSVLLMTMIMIGLLALSIVSYYQNLTPKFRGSHQGAAWHEALHGAEAGADYALRQLNTWAGPLGDPDAYAWTTNNWSYTNPLFIINGERSLDGSQLPNLGGQSKVRVTKITADVYTRENSGSSPSLNPWFRIRSTARADLPGKYVSADSRDIQLRRMKLAAKTGTGAADPNVTRTVEIVARPRYALNRAIVTLNDLSLGNSSNWQVDSFDSQDSSKSASGTAAGGVYPGVGSPMIQSNAAIASAKTNPTSSPYGALIAGNGATVLGNVQTNGGDDPSTAAFENVSGNTGMDQTRITADFNDNIAIPVAPTWTSWTYQGPDPGNGTGAFVTGTKAAPTRYAITGNLGTFGVTAPPVGTGYIEIIVTGNLDTGNGHSGIIIPPNVYAKIWVNGNIDFGNGNINAGSQSSQVATHLTVFGTGTGGTVTNPGDTTFLATGNASQILGLYAPSYSATLSGTVNTTGAFVVKNFTVNGGGSGGFHYDEALGRGGVVAGWEVASNFEDTRGDL